MIPILLVLLCLLHLPSFCHLFLLRISLLTCPLLQCHFSSLQQPCPAEPPHFSCNASSHSPGRTLALQFATKLGLLLLITGSGFPKGILYEINLHTPWSGDAHSPAEGTECSLLQLLHHPLMGKSISAPGSGLAVLWELLQISHQHLATFFTWVHKLPHVLRMVVNRKKLIPSTIPMEVWV